MTQTIPLTHAIEHARYWSMSRGTGPCYAELHPVNGNSVVVGYTAAELNRHDPRLYKALSSLIKRTTGRMVPQCLLMTLRLWATPARVDANLGYIGTITDIDQNQAIGTTIRCTGWHADVVSVAPSIDVVLNPRMRCMALDTAWLEHNYPGFLHRMLVAESLGLSSVAVAKAACTSPEVLVTVTLPEELIRVDIPNKD